MPTKFEGKSEMEKILKRIESQKQREMDAIEHLADLPETVYDAVQPPNPLLKSDAAASRAAGKKFKVRD